MYAPGKTTYLLCLERVVGRLDRHVLVAADLDAVCDDALGVALVGEGVGDGFALSVGDLVPSAGGLKLGSHPS